MLSIPRSLRRPVGRYSSTTVASMDEDPISGVPFDMVAPPHVKRYTRCADMEAHGDTVWRET